MTHVECVCPAGAQLGEGPVWSARERAVWFVDIKGKTIHRFRENNRFLDGWRAPEEVGFVVPATKNRLICGLQSGLYFFDRNNGEFAPIVQVDSHRQRNRLNDAFVDHAGRLWFGTMDNDETDATGSLYSFDNSGLHRRDEGYIITNGPTMSPDGQTLYHVDTMKQIIYAFEVSSRGQLSNRREFIHIDREGAYPDGVTVDANGDVWVGLFGGWGIHRYSPAGQLVQRIEFPVANCTKPMFGGEDLCTLYVTTAWKGLTSEQRAEQPLAGGLFALRVQVPGLPQHEVRYDG